MYLYTIQTVTADKAFPVYMYKSTDGINWTYMTKIDNPSSGTIIVSQNNDDFILVMNNFEYSSLQLLS